jgi:ribosome maturation protein SDO1
MEHINLAIFKKENMTFEIDIDPDLAMEFRNGKNIDILDIIKVQKIFSDTRKGNVAKKNDLEYVFGTTDVLEVAKQILMKGEIQVSSQFRKIQRDKKKKEIINLIHRNADDPVTHAPQPLARIEAAMEEAKIHIDETKSANEQIEEIIKKLRVIIPLKIETKHLQIMIPPAYSHKAYGKIIKIGKKINETWNDDGSLLLSIEIPAGIEVEFYEELNSLTHGHSEVKVLKR